MNRGRTPVVVAVAVALATSGCASSRRGAGTGDIAFRLEWNGISDLDLFVEDPAGHCIFFGNPHPEGGGVLDVDCNAGAERACGLPIENVFWPRGSAPPGRYRVWVHAHSLVPAEAPLAYRLNVLRGTRTAWSERGEMSAHEELHGPWLLTFPQESVRRASAPESLPADCSRPHRGLAPEPEEGAPAGSR